MQQRVLADVAALHQRLQRDSPLLALMGQHYVAPVGVVRQAAGGVDRVGMVNGTLVIACWPEVFTSPVT